MLLNLVRYDLCRVALFYEWACPIDRAAGSWACCRLPFLLLLAVFRRLSSLPLLLLATLGRDLSLLDWRRQRDRHFRAPFMRKMLRLIPVLLPVAPCGQDDANIHAKRKPIRIVPNDSNLAITTNDRVWLAAGDGEASIGASVGQTLPLVFVWVWWVMERFRLDSSVHLNFIPAEGSGR